MLLEKQRELQTLLGQSVHASIKVHGIYIPSRELQKRLHEFTQHLVNYTHDETYQVQFIGSATGLAFQGRRVLVATQHQMKGCRPDDIGILRLTNMSYLSSAGVLAIKSPFAPYSSDANDLCAFDYTPATGDDTELARHFFQLDENSLLREGDKVIGFLAYGCPFDHQVYDIVDRNHVGLVIKSITCQPVKQSFDEKLGSCQALSDMDFDPNGLSGGPVFATVLLGHEFVLKFAGIINISGGGFVHFIKAGAVVTLLNPGFDQL